MEFWNSEALRLGLLVLAGVGFLLQFDNWIEAIQQRKRGDDSQKPEKPSPPKG